MRRSGSFTYSDELYHYGVLGMKWGVRRYQDYNGRRLKNGKRVYNGKKTSKKYKSGMSMFISQRDNERKVGYYPSKTGGYTDEDIKTLSPDNIDDYINSFDDELKGFDDDEEVIKRLKDQATSFEDATSEAGKIVTDEYGINSDEANNNCGCISSSIICRKKGYDVYAGPMSDGISNLAMGYYFDNAERESVTKDNIQDAIKAHGPGSYGVMSFKTDAGNGHFTVWEVDDNENINIHEGQLYGSSKKNFTFDEYDKLVGVNSNNFDSCIYDLTNSEPNFKHMAEDHVVLPHDINARSMYENRTEEYNGLNYNNATYEDVKRILG